MQPPLEVEQGDDRLFVKHKEEKRVKAQAAIDAERQRIAEMQMREEAHQGPLDLVLQKRGVLLNLTTTERVYVGLGGLAVIGVLAALLGPFMWGFAPIVIVVVLASMVGRR